MDCSLLDRLITLENLSTSACPHNYCPDCNTPMVIESLEYHCEQCGRIGEYVEDSSKEDINSNRLRIGSGASKGRFYNPVTDYSKTQKKSLVEQFVRLQTEYLDKNSNYIAIPHRVISAVCDMYNTIQKKVVIMDDGSVVLIDESEPAEKHKKFVRRGTIKDEILAALIYVQCQNEGMSRKKKDVAAFMKLSTQGFSRGEDILRNLKAQGVIDVSMDDKSSSGYIERYLATLGMDLKYIDFINEIVATSEEQHVCMTSQTGSKVVGTIWLLIKLLKLPITVKQLEAATDNTKKNTFDKFTKCIESSMGIFSHIFRKYELID